MSQKRLVLVYGLPGEGKTTLAHELLHKKGYRWISTDRVYVDWIRDRYPDFFFPRLRQFVFEHWNEIIRVGEERDWIVEDMVAAWIEHLLDVAVAELDHHPKVVVEGSLVTWAYERLSELLNDSVEVLVIKAHEERYLDESNNELQLNEIAGP